MLEHHTATVSPISNNNNWNKFKFKIESNRIWLKLLVSLLIPLMIGIFTITMSFVQQNVSFKQRIQDRDDAEKLRLQSMRLADNIEKETILANYLNEISRLLISENDTKIYEHIRIKTLTSLRQLQMDIERKQYLFLFLYQSQLLSRESPSKLKINDANFNGIQFNGSEEMKCSFDKINLFDIYLSDTYFSQCYIDRTIFSYSTMNNATFIGGLILRSSFNFTSLKRAYFSRIRLKDVSFMGANLFASNFTGTSLENGSISFINANLLDSNLSDLQLKNASLFNCILPNGTWGPIQKENLIPLGDFDKNCNQEALKDWTIRDGELKMIVNISRCHFRVVLFNQTNKLKFVYLSQLFSLEEFSLLIMANKARYNISADFQCFGTQYATIRVQLTDENGLRSNEVSTETASGTTDVQSINISNILRSDTRHLRILITIFQSRSSHLNLSIDDNACVCYNIKLTMSKIL